MLFSAEVPICSSALSVVWSKCLSKFSLTRIHKNNRNFNEFSSFFYLYVLHKAYAIPHFSALGACSLIPHMCPCYALTNSFSVSGFATDSDNYQYRFQQFQLSLTGNNTAEQTCIVDEAGAADHARTLSNDLVLFKSYSKLPDRWAKSITLRQIRVLRPTTKRGCRPLLFPMKMFVCTRTVRFVSP